MSAAVFMMRHRYGYDARRGPRFGETSSEVNATADQFVLRARASTRFTCPACRVGGVVEEVDDDGLKTGRLIVVVAVPPGDVRAEAGLSALASSLAAAGGVAVEEGEAVSTPVAGRLAKLIPFTFSRSSP